MHTPYAVNILSVFDKCSAETIESGRSWYDNAKSFAKSLDPENHHRAAGIIAALSPMTAWPQNQKLAQTVYRGEYPRCLSRNAEKALAIYNGGEPLSVLSGPKVRAFYANIVGLDGAITVTIDRHAIDIAMGRVCSDSERGTVSRGKRYAELANAYIDATERLNARLTEPLTPSQLQAIVWVHWRQNVIRNYHGEGI